MSFSSPFIRRPVATSLLAAAVFLSGAVAYTRLALAPMPKVEMPTIQVSANLPGASPETMASAVATPLERRFGRIAGITEITSNSSLGSTNLTLQFELTRDQDSAARDVQAAINAAGGELPSNLPSRPNYRKANPADAPILILSLRSESLPISAIYDTANTVLGQRIAQVEGVGQVFVGGGQQPAVRVQADPAKLASADLTLEDLRTALARASVDLPKGVLGGDRQAYTIDADDQLFDAAAYANLVVKTGAGGEIVRLRDVATVVDGVENARVAAWANGERGVVMLIRRQPGANILQTIDRVKALLPELQRSLSPALEIQVAIDRAQTIRASVAEVEHSLIISVLLVIGVVFLFLRRAAATAIPSVAVPISLVGTFAVMYFLDYSLNNLSLMALTISTGFVVDDAIVMTENVQRNIEKGLRPLEAALEGARQIGFTIISITVSLIAVFIPILMMGGLIGRLFREFAVTLTVAIVVSALVSLTLTPMMCGRLLRPVEPGEMSAVERVLERGFLGFQAAYTRALDWVLGRRRLMLAVTLATIGLSVGLYVSVPKGLFPQQDTGFITGFTEAPQDVSFATMKERQEQLNKILLTDPDVNHTVSFIGGGGGSTGNTGSLFFDLKPKPQRKASAEEIIARLRPKFAQVPGISFFMQAAQDVRMGGRPSRTQYQYTLQDADLDELRRFAPLVLAKLKSLPVLKDVATDQQTGALQLRLVVDRDTAARFGIPAQRVDDTLYDAFGQRQVGVTFTERTQQRVILEITPELQGDVASLGKLHVRAADGSLVPLDAFTHVEPGTTPMTINHQGQFPAVTLSFNLAPNAALGAAVDAIRQAELELGFPAGLRGDFSGTAQAFKSSSSTQPLLILAALIAVYLVLGLLYESLIHPITILSTLPSAGVGALLALLVVGTELSLIALIGIILLIGIVKKNAIMMIDFAIEAEREEGLSPEQAIRQACIQRLRPIMMTTLAALLGGLPLAFGQGAGAELRQPLGIAIVGGLLISQLLTLFTTPVVYLALDRWTGVARRRARAPAAEPLSAA